MKFVGAVNVACCLWKATATTIELFVVVVIDGGSQSSLSSVVLVGAATSRSVVVLTPLKTIAIDTVFDDKLLAVVSGVAPILL